MPAAPAASIPSPLRHAAVWSVSVGALLALCAAGPAHAAERRLAVVELTTPPTMVGLGAQVVQEIEAAARAQGYELLGPQLLQDALGQAGWRDLLRCQEDLACVAAQLSSTRATHAVVGSLDRDERSYRLKLELVDLASKRSVAGVDRSILIASRRFRQDVAEAVPRLLRGEGESRGTLSVSSSVSGARVFVDEGEIGATPLQVQLKPGRYRVRVEKPGHLSLQRLANVEANKQTHEHFRMLREPGAAEEPLVTASVRAGGRPPPSNHVPASMILGGAALAAAGGGLYLGFTEGPPRQLTFARFLYGTAGVAAIAGILTYAFGEEDRIQASAAILPGGGGAVVSGRF